MPLGQKPGNGEALPALGRVLEELGKRRAKLDALDTQLSDLIPRVEDALRSHIATRVFTVIESGEDLWQRNLTFGKWDGRWQFLIEHGEIDDPENWKTQPLSTGPRELKTSVFVEGHIERLIRGALSQVDKQIQDRETAMKIANSLIGTLGAPPDEVFGGVDPVDEFDTPPGLPAAREGTAKHGPKHPPQKKVATP